MAWTVANQPPMRLDPIYRGKIKISLCNLSLIFAQWKHNFLIKFSLIVCVALEATDELYQRCLRTDIHLNTT